jgi:hypothetical protein
MVFSLGFNNSPLSLFDFLSDLEVDSPVMVFPTQPPVGALETQAPTLLPTPALGEDIATSLPTPLETAFRTDDPGTSVPTSSSPPISDSAPSSVTFSPSTAPLEPCISTDGTFGVVSGTLETDVAVRYMYEMETVFGVSKEKIDRVILPQLEKAIVDSVLDEIFPNGCVGTGVGKRHLRLQRRLTVTGITMNPADLINDERTL